MWSTCNKQTNILVSAHGLNETISFLPSFQLEDYPEEPRVAGDWGLIFWVSTYIATETEGAGPVLFTLLSPTTEKC